MAFMAFSVIFFLSFSAFHAVKERSKTHAASEEEARYVELLGELNPDVPVKATDMVQDFKRSKNAAKGKYHGKMFSVTGVVQHAVWSRSVWLQGGTSIGGSGNLCFNFGVEHERLVDRLSRGQVVTIRGRCEVRDAETAWLEFNDCELVEERP